MLYLYGSKDNEPLIRLPKKLNNLTHTPPPIASSKTRIVLSLLVSLSKNHTHQIIISVHHDTTRSGILFRKWFNRDKKRIMAPGYGDKNVPFGEYRITSSGPGQGPRTPTSTSCLNSLILSSRRNYKHRSGIQED